MSSAILNMLLDKFGIFRVILIVSIVFSVHGRKGYKVDDAVDINIYIIPGFPGEFPNGYDSMDIDKHAHDVGNDVIEMAKNSGFDIGLGADDFLKNEVKGIQDLVKHDEKGLHTYNPKTHLAKTVEKEDKHDKADSKACMEGIGDQNVITKAISHHGNSLSSAVGHGNGDAIAISGDQDPSEVMKAFKNFFKK